MNEVLSNKIVPSLNKILKKKKYKNILIITGKNSYKNSKAYKYFKKISSVYPTVLYHKSMINSCYAEVSSVLEKFLELNFDIIIAYGGGSVIDFSKLVSLYKNNAELFKTDFQNTNKIIETVPLVAIPTTAGSGAESTQFAVMYKENIKFSILNKNIIPQYVILDPETTFTLSKYQTACSGIDALCQSLESCWAKNKNVESEEYALKSLELINENIIESYNGNKESRSLMLEAANLSGKAINISKTTAPHAMSYYLTSFHDIPHGEAVGINIEPFININFESIEEKIKRKILHIFNVKTKVELINSIRLLKSSLGLKLKLSEVEGLDVEEYCSHINIERLKNNPVELKIKDVRKLIIKSISK